MTVSRRSDGRFRARVWLDGREVSVSKVLGPDATSFKSEREARRAYFKAREIVAGSKRRSVTVGEFWQRWTTEDRFARPKRSTDIKNLSRTRAFAKKYAEVPLADVDRRIVDEWLAGGRRSTHAKALSAMFYDAQRWELVDRNPFAKLGLSRGKGNRDVPPPSEETVWALIAAAKRIAGPGFAGWLQLAAFTGMRPGEIDALKWDRVDFERGIIRVVEQFNGLERGFSLPKNNHRRNAILTPQAREALLEQARVSEFCFVNLSGSHWRREARTHWWDKTRFSVGYDGSLYLATRHFAGWFMVNELGLDSEDVAIALGHEDGGRLVATLYGHRDRGRAADRVRAAYEARSNVVPLRGVK